MSGNGRYHPYSFCFISIRKKGDFSNGSYRNILLRILTSLVWIKCPSFIDYFVRGVRVCWLGQKIVAVPGSGLGSTRSTLSGFLPGKRVLLIEEGEKVGIREAKQVLTTMLLWWHSLMLLKSNEVIMPGSKEMKYNVLSLHKCHFLLLAVDVKEKFLETWIFSFSVAHLPSTLTQRSPWAAELKDCGLSSVDFLPGKVPREIMGIKKSSPGDWLSPSVCCVHLLTHP